MKYSGKIPAAASTRIRTERAVGTCIVASLPVDDVSRRHREDLRQTREEWGTTWLAREFVPCEPLTAPAKTSEKWRCNRFGIGSLLSGGSAPSCFHRFSKSTAKSFPYRRCLSYISHRYWPHVAWCTAARKAETSMPDWQCHRLNALARSFHSILSLLNCEFQRVWSMRIPHKLH